MGLFSKKTEMVSPEGALPGRDREMPVPARHHVLGTPLRGPFPDGLEMMVVGMGCFWGAGEKFWQASGGDTTAGGYAGGDTAHPSHEEECCGRTGDTEAM